MKKKFGPYRRLARGMLGCSSLWESEDHILYVKGTGLVLPFREQYLRFALRDIQGMAIAPTHTGTVITVVSGVVAATALVGGALLFWSTRASSMKDFMTFLAVLCGIAAAIALPICLVNLFLGPTCHCAVQTASQTERLRPLRRVRRARKVIEKLSTLIHARQASTAVTAQPSPTAQPSETP